MGPPPKRYLCYRAASPLSIDGRLTHPAWDAAPWTDDFVDIEGDAKPAPRFRTRAKMLWDDEYLYIGAELEEPHVWATLTEHDSVIFQDNDFEIFIDPDGDNHNYYEIEINALNTVWDLRLPRPYRDGGSAINSWEIPGLKSAVYIDGTRNDSSDIDRGWTVEMAFPWAVLGEFANRKAPPADGDQWRINFSRVEWDVDIVDGAYVKVQGRPEHNWVWSPQGMIDMHWPERWGYLQFSTAAPGSTQVRADPSAGARERLMSVYYAQRDFRRARGHWAENLPLLSLAETTPDLRLTITETGWEATMPYRGDDSIDAVLTIGDDSRIYEAKAAGDAE